MKKFLLILSAFLTFLAFESFCSHNSVDLKNSLENRIEEELKEFMFYEKRTKPPFDNIYENGLFLAILGSNKYSLEELDLKRVDLNKIHEDKDDYSFLDHACIKQQITIIETLLKNNALISKQTLHCFLKGYKCDYQNFIYGINLLIKKGADVNAKDREGNTPLMIAKIKNSPLAALQILILNGADITKKNKNQTVLDYYCGTPNIGIYNLSNGFKLLKLWAPFTKEYNEYKKKTEQNYFETIKESSNRIFPGELTNIVNDYIKHEYPYLSFQEWIECYHSNMLPELKMLKILPEIGIRFVSNPSKSDIMLARIDEQKNIYNNCSEAVLKKDNFQLD